MILDVIRERVKIHDILNKYGIDCGAEGKAMVSCPFHDEKSPSFSIYADGDRFKCFSCGRGGDVFELVALKEDVEFRGALQIVADMAGIAIGDRGKALKSRKKSLPVPKRSYARNELWHKCGCKLAELVGRREKKVGYSLAGFEAYVLKTLDGLHVDKRLTLKKARRLIKYTKGVLKMFPPLPKRCRTFGQAEDMPF